MKIFQPSKLLKSLNTAEKKKMREAVIPELEKYRFFRELEHLTKDQEAFCKRLETAIEGLTTLEKLIITKRYTSYDAEYVTDYQVYNNCMNPPVSRPTYNTIRDNALLKIALFMGIYTGVDISID